MNEFAEYLKDKEDGKEEKVIHRVQMTVYNCLNKKVLI